MVEGTEERDSGKEALDLDGDEPRQRTRSARVLEKVEAGVVPSTRWGYVLG